MNLKEFYHNKVVLITGASMGIGKEIAHNILLNGGKIIITGRNEERLNAVATEFSAWKDRILVHQGDVADYANNLVLIEKTIERFGRLDILINNAGLSCFGEVAEMEARVAKKIIDVNIYGSLFPVMAALPELKKSKGTIFFVSSIAAFHGIPGYSAYSLSKMSLKALAQSLRFELTRNGVSVCISFVGFTENENDKRTLSPKGEWITLPPRSSRVTTGRTITAVRILKQIRDKNFSSTHSIFGNVTSYMSRYFPGLMTVIFKWRYKRMIAQKQTVPNVPSRNEAKIEVRDLTES